MIDYFKARTNSEFDVAESYRSYAINDVWKSNVALWNLISAFAGDASSKLYERIVDMTKNISDIDICDVKQLESLSYQLGLKSGFGFIDSLPSEIYDLINVLSVKQSYFFEKNQIFTESGMDSIMDEIPSSIEKIVGNSAIISDAVIEAIESITLSMVEDRRLTEAQRNACVSAVNVDGSINSLESLIYSGDTSEMPEDRITENQYASIKMLTIAKLLDSGKLNYSDYKSSHVQSSSFKDVLNINVRPAVEFEEVVENGSIVINYKVNHSIRVGTSSELSEFLSNEIGSKFNIYIWTIRKQKFLSLIENIDGISERTKLNIAESSKQTSGKILQDLLRREMILKSEFTTILNAINAISIYDIIQIYIDDGLSIYRIASDLKEAGVINENGTVDEFVNYYASKGFRKAIELMQSLGKADISKFNNKEELSLIYDKIVLLDTFNSISISSAEAKIPNGIDALAVYKNNEWLLFKNIWSRFPGMELTENNDVKSGQFVQFIHGSETLQLPATNLVDMQSKVGISVKFETVPMYVGFQVFLNDIIYKSYFDLLKEKLNCVLNAGNETDLSLYKSDFLKYTNESGFNQYVNDKNVNFGFYRALVLSNFCSNICSNRNLVGDWFLDSTLHAAPDDENLIDIDEVLDDVCRTLCDMTLSVTVRREILKKLANQYSRIGSNAGIEKVIGDFIIRNFTKRSEDWNLVSNTAVLNDAALPTLENIRKKFDVSITEYYDNNEYLNISADSEKKTIWDGRSYDTTSLISSSIDVSGNLVTGMCLVRTKHYDKTNEPIVSGGNERFWTTADYKIRLNNQTTDIIDFYKNVNGASESLSSIDAISAFVTTLWENCSLSALSSESMEMHRKYIGDNTGYSRAVNAGNPNYPTIAPIESIANLTEVYGNMERDYQSIMNDDRPAIVEGTAPAIISAYSCVPVDEEDYGTYREIIGIPPFYTYPPQDYVRTVVNYEERQGIRPEERHEISGYQVSGIKWDELTGYHKISSAVPDVQISTWVERIITEITSWISYFKGGIVTYDSNRVYKSYLGEIVEKDLDSDDPDAYISTYYDISGLVSQEASSMNMTSVVLAYETPVGKFSASKELEKMNIKWAIYLNNEELLPGSGEIYELSSEFQNVRNEISGIKVDYYSEHLINEDIVKAYDYYPLTSVVTYTYDPNEIAISSYNEDIGEWEISSYGNYVSQITAYAGNISSHVSDVNERNAFLAYTNAVIGGRIVYQDENYLIKYYGWISNPIKRLSQINSLRAEIDARFDQVTAHSTLDNYDAYKATIRSEVELADDLDMRVRAYYGGGENPPITGINPLSYYSDSILGQLFGDSISAVDKITNTINLDVEPIIGYDVSYVDASAEITSWTTRWDDVPYTYQVSSVEWKWEYQDRVYYVDVSYTYYEEISSQIISYKVIESENLPYNESETPQMFDVYGGLINSWRNVNVELRGYNSCYEASPNLNRNYTEQKYIDVDGPWIGEALYDLLYQLIPLSGGYDMSGHIITPDPIPENMDVYKLKSEHYYNSSTGVKENKWWLPEYVEKLRGHDIEKQLSFYVSDIIDCRRNTIFEVEVDSFNNQYTLYKPKSELYNYDCEGVLWLRHNGFPYSFPIMEKPYKGWEDSSASTIPTITNKIGTYSRSVDNDYEDDNYGKLFAWKNDSLNPSIMYTSYEYPEMLSLSFNRNYIPAVEATIIDMDMRASQESIGNNIDQIYLGYTMMSHRSIFNRCLAFGVNNTSLWAAGYDGKNSDGSDHFNIRIVQLKYFEINGIRYYGTRNPRTLNKLNSDPVGYDSNNLVAPNLGNEYQWLDFCGGYYDGNVINFVFYGKSGFRFRIYNLSNARLNAADVIAEFDSSINVAENYEPFIHGANDPILSNRHNPFRLVEDNDYCYIGWVSKKTVDGIEKKKLVVCQNDKKNYAFKSILAWNVPDYEESDELESLIAGVNTVKVRFKSGVKYGKGHVYYGRISQSGFASNEGVEDLYPAENMKMNYVVDDSEEDVKTNLPSIPIIDITQWRHWGYSLTDNSLLTISYADAINVFEETSAAISPSGMHYNVLTEKTYLPGNCMTQSVIAYDPYSGVDDSAGTRILTGYNVGLEINELTPFLQGVIPAYAPQAMSAEIIPSTSDHDMAVIANSTPVVLNKYYGLPYNNLYVERTDLDSNLVGQNDQFQPNSEYNWMVLKNFYNYAYEHEYNWNNAVLPYDDSSLDKIVGWRKYKKCSISRYSDSMWMSYNYLRDYTILLQSNKQQSVAYVMNDYEFVEVVYGTIQLMNTNYNKSDVFSISINNSTLNMQGYDDNSEETAKKRENAKNQIKDEIRNMIDDYAPAHTQLWKIEFKN